MITRATPYDMSKIDIAIQFDVRLYNVEGIHVYRIVMDRDFTLARADGYSNQGSAGDSIFQYGEGRDAPKEILRGARTNWNGIQELYHIKLSHLYKAALAEARR